MRTILALVGLLALAVTAVGQSADPIPTANGASHGGGENSTEAGDLQGLADTQAPVSDPDPAAADDVVADAADTPSGGAATRPSPALRALGRLPERLGWLGERYLWLVPEGGVQIVSLLLLGLLLLGACIHLGAGAAGLEGRSLMRSVGFAALVLVLAGIQLAAVVPSTLAIGLMIAGNGLVWFLATRSLFGAGFVESATVLVIGALLVGVGFLLLEVVDFVMVTEAARVA